MALAKFPARSIETVLGQLMVLRRQANSGEQVQLPCTVFHLRSGRSMRGWLLDLDTERNEQHMLIHTSDCTHPPKYDVSYVALRDVEAITIENAGVAAVALSFGAVPVAPGTPAPTRMALRRRAEEISASLTDIKLALMVGLDDDTDDATRHTIGMVLEILGGVLMEINRDAIGSQALASVQSITLGVGASFVVQRDGEGIVLFAPAEGGAVPRQMLYDELAQVL